LNIAELKCPNNHLVVVESVKEVLVCMMISCPVGYMVELSQEASVVSNLTIYFCFHLSK